ncbi:CBO0543 family protein [Effusibacillus lacus]|uniref:Uncharacterized protein n=1 Tax=Effusibacillus lacus TaxID=1348429 RepID=A0A292YJ43_9BACL|nr:CBO0543 family protein [Effusibacillus lacus]TCS75465.1 hypothetical protein EDD64_10720 [Effusibacillus lacus]GAX88931.1 hypothetical protein EFBL_0545 [Effusibacillus lacus]
MYYIAVFFVSWIWWYLKADKTRLREMFGAVVFTMFLGLLTDLIMVHYKLWDYEGLPEPIYTIPLLLDYSVYPVVAYLFAQNLPETWGDILKRTLIWTGFAICFEWITLKTGHMEHHQWWNLWLSLAADILIFLSMAAIFRYYRTAYLRSESNPG